MIRLTHRRLYSLVVSLLVAAGFIGESASAQVPLVQDNDVIQALPSD